MRIIKKVNFLKFIFHFPSILVRKFPFSKFRKWFLFFPKTPCFEHAQFSENHGRDGSQGDHDFEFAFVVCERVSNVTGQDHREAAGELHSVHGAVFLWKDQYPESGNRWAGMVAWRCSFWEAFRKTTQISRGEFLVFNLFGFLNARQSRFLELTWNGFFLVWCLR